MEIKIKMKEKKTLTFGDLNIGDVFTFKEDLNPNDSIDELCIGIKSDDCGYTCLSSGYHVLYGFETDSEVIALNAVLTIEGVKA